MDGADIRMIQRGSGSGFAAEALERLRIARQFVRQKLQRDEAAQLRILSSIDHAHASAAQLLDDAVARDGLADQCGDYQCIVTPYT